MLKQILSHLDGRQVQFLLLRIVGVDKQAALGSLAIPEGTYKRWVAQKKFQEVYRQREELNAEYRDEALLLLRERNYALVVSLECELLEKMREEIRDDKPVFAKTHLGREVYTKLASEMSTKPQIQHLTWEQLILQGSDQPQLGQGEVIDANSKDAHNEADSSPKKEHSES